MGWMQGFPPAQDRLITQPDSNYFSFPKLRWSVCHLRELLPTEQISRGLGAPSVFPYALDDNIDALSFTPMNSDAPMSWEESLFANYTDGILVLHQGRVVYERYFGCLKEDGKHAIMSMTKSVTGLLAQILVAEGVLDDGLQVIDIIPEIKGSAFANATVRQVMDMTTGVKYSEDYSDPNADIWLYSKAASPLPRSSDYDGPDGYWEYLHQVEAEGDHGESFHYKTINSDMLGWIISRVSGKSVTQLASERLWRRMGAEQDAYQTVDGKGVPFAGGGITAGLRDLGRLGLLMLNEGVINGERLFPAEVVRTIRAGGDPSKFRGFPTIANGSYTSQWWLFHNANGALAARGVHGQTIYVDPLAEMVIVRFASYPRAQNSFIDPTSLPAYQAVADYLVAKNSGLNEGNGAMTDSVELLGTWQITHFAGEPVIEDSEPEIRFTESGEISGNASCNRFSGRYSMDAGNLRIGDEYGNLAVTRMMCPEHLMVQEDAFLRLLPTIDAFEVAADRSLILRAAGVEILRAQRR
jgi:CubicO group peptidase (beta-lactamase class C family)